MARRWAGELAEQRGLPTLGFLLALAVLGSPSDAADRRDQREKDKRLAAFEQRAAEQREKFRADLEKRKPTFEPAQAPPPEVCLAKYILTVRQAKSMEAILPYLRPEERKVLQDTQRQYDPKLAAQRRAQYRKEGMAEDAIEHLTNSPYANAYKWHRGVAERIQKITKAEVDGSEARLTVAIKTHAIINGAVYTNSTATVGMVGEGKYWYMSTYRESIVYEP